MIRKIGPVIIAVLGAVLLLRTLGAFTPAPPDTFLGLSAQLKNKDTNRPITEAVVTLVGNGFPPQATTQVNGVMGVLSSSRAEAVPLTLAVAGYKPYNLTIFRQERVMICTQCMMPVLLLTPNRRTLPKGRKILP